MSSLTLLAIGTWIGSIGVSLVQKSKSETSCYSSIVDLQVSSDEQSCNVSLWSRWLFFIWVGSSEQSSKLHYRWVGSSYLWASLSGQSSKLHSRWVGSLIIESAQITISLKLFKHVRTESTLSFFELARMDCADFSILLESTLPSSSWLRSIYPKILMLLESALIHWSRLEWSVSEMYSARVGSPSFESAWVIDFFESLEHATIKSALHSQVNSSVYFLEKNLIWNLEYIELTFWSTRPLFISSSLPYRSNPYNKTLSFIKQISGFFFTHS